MLVEGTFDVDLARDALYSCMVDPELIAACLPGCESISRISATSYRAVVFIGMGSIKARFNLVVEVTLEEPPLRVLSVTRGEEGGRASQLSATNTVSLADLGGDATRVHYASDVSITGRLGKFALGVMRKKVQSLADEFAMALRAKVRDAAGERARRATTTTDAEPHGEAAHGEGPLPESRA